MIMLKQITIDGSENTQIDGYCKFQDFLDALSDLNQFANGRIEVHHLDGRIVLLNVINNKIQNVINNDSTIFTPES